VIFVVGTVGVSQTGSAHGEATGVPGAGDFERVGGKGSEDIDEGVGRDIFLETCGEWFVENMFDGKG
jgi:hypothetical protein